jgi:putative flavoprotein involved in K+ transport
MSEFSTERVDTVVVGGGQAGLSVGYHLQRRGVPFVILDASERIGDAWRRRWDSLRLFTPAKFSSLDGLPFPGDRNRFPTKDDMADYLERYAAHFRLPVHSGVEVDRLTRPDDRFRVAAGDVVFEADHVVVAIGTDQRQWIPEGFEDLDPAIRQIRSSDYERPDQLLPGDALVVGAGNSGVEIALDVHDGRHVLLAGEYPGAVPFDVEGRIAQLILVRLVLRGVFHRVISMRTPFGRRAIRKLKPKGKALVRTKPADIERAGVEHVPRVVGVDAGRPLLADGRVLDVANVIWATGYRPTLDWIDVDVMETDAHGLTEPRQRAGIVDEVPGLYFVGLDFLYAASSGQIHGVGRDAARVAAHLADHRRATSWSDGSTRPRSAAEPDRQAARSVAR